ncbi:hypothetical protein HSRCO_2101 [Halanaeroarchaeum sp. HSR-CO]|nr:hypothetical protein HSRCO_2101 [Halanaeroarchaeum sp. HSR-CO]
MGRQKGCLLYLVDRFHLVVPQDQLPDEGDQEQCDGDLQNPFDHISLYERIG